MMKNSSPPNARPAPAVLIVEPDGTTAHRMVAALGGGHAALPSRRAGDHGPTPCRGECTVLGTMEQLFDCNLARTEIVICAVTLPDGSGLAALDYLRERHPGLPVILVGAPEEAGVAVEAIRGGAVDFLTTGHDLQALPLAVEKCLTHERVRREHERLQRNLGDSLTQLASRNQQLQALVRQLEVTATTDYLTGLCNRRSLNEALQRSWQRVAAGGLRLAIMMIDLDGFKQVNDRLGHLRGDDVLREAARIIQVNCRQGDVSARFGGDEFCVLMPDCEAAEAEQAARRLIEEYRRFDRSRCGVEPPLSVSIGIAHTECSAPATAADLLRHADDAMYAAKSAGKGRLMVCCRGRQGRLVARARTA